MGEADDEVAVARRTRARDEELVGREPELAQLTRGLDDVLANRSQLFLLAGEAGIGKSRLADEIATVARQRDFFVVWGRCWEAGGAPAYWPWAQVVRTCLRENDAGGPPVVPVVPALEELARSVPTRLREAERSRLASSSSTP